MRNCYYFHSCSGNKCLDSELVWHKKHFKTLKNQRLRRFGVLLGKLICRVLAGEKRHRRTGWLPLAALKPVEFGQMRPSEALFLNRTQIREIALSHRVSSVRVFGSTLHGDDTAESDLDLLVELVKPTAQTTLMDIGAIRFKLKQLLGIKVEVLDRVGHVAIFSF